MKKIFISIGSLVSVALPSLVLAAGSNIGSGSYFGTLIKQAGELLQLVLIFLISLSVVWFIWNVIKYSMSGEEDGKEKAKSQMINGIIAIAVTVSVWGIVALLQGAFGVNTNNGAPDDINNMIPGGSSLPNGVSQYQYDNSMGSEPFDPNR
ncbi:MAG: hypothetical protein WCP24_01110 [bacterium]